MIHLDALLIRRAEISFGTSALARPESRLPISSDSPAQR
jgi:hypothetical protein